MQGKHEIERKNFNHYFNPHPMTNQAPERKANGKILAKGGKYSTTDELCRNVAKSANAHSNYRQPAFCQYIVSCRF